MRRNSIFKVVEFIYISNSSEVDIEDPQPKKKTSKQEENVKLIKNLKKQAPDAVPSGKPQQAQQTGIRAAHVTKINRAWEPLDSAEPEQAKLSALMEGYNKRDSMLVECGECWFNIQVKTRGVYLAKPALLGGGGGCAVSLNSSITIIILIFSVNPCPAKYLEVFLRTFF